MFLHSYQTIYNYPVYSTSAINLRVIKCPCTFTHFQITYRIRAWRRAPATSISHNGQASHRFSASRDHPYPYPYSSLF
jgi:hypothetical protein